MQIRSGKIIQSGDVLLYSSTNLIGRLIRKLDGTDITHAGIYLGDDQVGEALMVGNAGINSNSIEESFEGTDWVEVHRLTNSTLDMKPVMEIAKDYIEQNNRYAYAEILLVAAICLTRKANLANTRLGTIAFWAMRKANKWINRRFSEGKEPMICSEFVFRCYDEADPADNDPYSLDILSQVSGSRRRRFSRTRRQERIFEAKPEAELPTVHPESLFIEVQKTPKLFGAAPAKKDEISDAEFEHLVSEYLGEESSLDDGSITLRDGQVPVTSAPRTEISKEVLEAEAARFASNLALQNRTMFSSAPFATASTEQRAKAAVADFVTPGDLYKSPSLEFITKIPGQ